MQIFRNSCSRLARTSRPVSVVRCSLCRLLRLGSAAVAYLRRQSSSEFASIAILRASSSSLQAIAGLVLTGLAAGRVTVHSVRSRGALRSSLRAGGLDLQSPECRSVGRRSTHPDESERQAAENRQNSNKRNLQELNRLKITNLNRKSVTPAA